MRQVREAARNPENINALTLTRTLQLLFLFSADKRHQQHYSSVRERTPENFLQLKNQKTAKRKKTRRKKNPKNEHAKKG